MGSPAVFEVLEVTGTEIWIVDREAPGAFSITNDAERVCERVVAEHGDKRLFYRDTDRRWDELVHEGGRFIRFSFGTDGHAPPSWFNPEAA